MYTHFCLVDKSPWYSKAHAKCKQVTWSIETIQYVHVHVLRCRNFHIVIYFTSIALYTNGQSSAGLQCIHVQCMCNV